MENEILSTDKKEDESLPYKIWEKEYCEKFKLKIHETHELEIFKNTLLTNYSIKVKTLQYLKNIFYVVFALGIYL